jgi:hypothetical protein
MALRLTQQVSDSDVDAEIAKAPEEHLLQADEDEWTAAL